MYRFIFSILVLVSVGFSDARLPLTIKENGRTYYFSDSTDVRSWYDSLKMCQSMGMTLIELRSQADHYNLAKVMTENQIPIDPAVATWIGGTDDWSEGNYIWISDYSPIKTFNWRVNEPNNYLNNENCLGLWPYGNSLKWNDGLCENKWNYICFQRSIPLPQGSAFNYSP